MGVSDVAVLEKCYIGGGGLGRNTAIIRSWLKDNQSVVQPWIDAAKKAQKR